MAWTTPKTWASGYVVLAADLNTHLRDNLNVTAPAVMSSQGDVIYASGVNTPARLAKSTTSTQYLANTGSSNNPAWNEVALATGVSGTLPVGNGGTGATSLTANGVIIGNTASALTSVDMSTKGHLLIGDGSGNPQMLGVGSNDEVLTADSGETTGVKWAAAGGGDPEFQTVMKAYIEGGTAKVIYLMGGSDIRIMIDSGNDTVTNLIGLGLIAHSNHASSYIQKSTTIEGGWQFLTNSGNTHYCGLKSSRTLDPTNDWTFTWRGIIPSAGTQVFHVGLANGANLRPPNETNMIGFRVTNTGNIFGFVDSGGTETTVDTEVAPSDTERTLRMVTSSTGTSIEFFVDNATKGTITSNIPTGDTFQLQFTIETRTTATRQIHVADFYAHREVG